jgi:glucosamine--fructose-6-phosphate aminotransferase (isomerizing)
VARAMRVAENLFFAGCGTAGKVAQMGTYLFADVAGRPSASILGSEFKNYRHSLHERTLLVAISQSGETADLLEAVEVAKARGSTVVAVVNVPGSTLTRLADHTLLVNAGPEKAVASTKATLGQIAIITLLAHASSGLAGDGCEVVAAASTSIDRTLTRASLQQIRELARRFKDARDIYIIGRGLSYPVALEAAIKIQEVSYIHAEGLAGGELKHYAIALIEPGTPCIALVPNDQTRQEILSNATEVKARGGVIVGIAPEPHPIFDVHLPVVDAGMASAIVNLVPVQVLAYYLAVERGFDPDMPRNLAKSVTVK